METKLDVYSISMYASELDRCTFSLFVFSTTSWFGPMRQFFKMHPLRTIALSQITQFSMTHLKKKIPIDYLQIRINDSKNYFKWWKTEKKIIKKININTNPSSIVTPFIRTLLEIRVFGLTVVFVPRTQFFNEVFSVIVALSATAHAVICVERTLACGDINVGASVGNSCPHRSFI